MAETDGKRAVGHAAVDRFVRDGTCIGLGTGTTAYWAIDRVAARVGAGERIEVVPTSRATEALCREHGVLVRELGTVEIDVAIDGADEVAADRSLTKGGGGAMFREKAVALAARRFVVIVTPEKLVHTLGAFATPVEVVPFSVRVVAAAIEAAYPGIAVRRRGGDEPFVTDNGNAILDCAFGSIGDAVALDAALRSIHGVVATGLFAPDLATTILVADGAAAREL
ncbi:MAG TPA: ribose-5-phosphate isomerase RpiA [Candidatus Elarobacter sp.]|jgi:ribose 5-phosphate isomerase A|nr:ribose-5-phosphate isomerase RpiA [Candidatus Elarobacter sp.]